MLWGQHFRWGTTAAAARQQRPTRCALCGPGHAGCVTDFQTVITLVSMQVSFSKDPPPQWRRWVRQQGALRRRVHETF